MVLKKRSKKTPRQKIIYRLVFSDNEYLLNKKNSTDNNYLSKKKKMPTAKTILKMKENMEEQRTLLRNEHLLKRRMKKLRARTPLLHLRN